MSSKQNLFAMKSVKELCNNLIKNVTKSYTESYTERLC